jgi:hypothetical protein
VYCHLIHTRRFKPKLTSKVISTTPKFSTAIYAPTTLYDVMEDIYSRQRRETEGKKYNVGEIVFYRDIWPLLQRPSLLSWVNAQANGGHGGPESLSAFDHFIFNVIQVQTATVTFSSHLGGPL